MPSAAAMSSPPADATPARGSLAQMMARRYEAYKTYVVRPFFRDHFALLDRQIVLIDVLALAGLVVEHLRIEVRPGANRPTIHHSHDGPARRHSAGDRHRRSDRCSRWVDAFSCGRTDFRCRRVRNR